MDDSRIAANRIFLGESDPRFDDRVRLLGVGREETMPPGFVSRREGLAAWLLVIFHHPVTAQLRGRREALNRGSLVLWEPRRQHFFGSERGAWSHSWIAFSGSEFVHDVESMSGHCELALRLRCEKHLLDHFLGLLREFNEFRRPDPFLIAANLKLILREIARELELETRGLPERDEVRAAREFIRRNLGRPISVSEVAREVRLSPSRLQQLFRASLGETVLVHIERLRLQNARYWLDHTGLKIAAVAARAGFADPLYFSRRFSRALGLSPSEYRKSRSGGGAQPR